MEIKTLTSRGKERLPKPYRKDGKVNIYKIEICEDTYKVLQALTQQPRISDKEIKQICSMFISTSDQLMMAKAFDGDKEAINYVISTLPTKA